MEPYVIDELAPFVGERKEIWGQVNPVNLYVGGRLIWNYIRGIEQALKE